MSEARPNNQVIEEAAAFHARVASGDMTPTEWQELAAWLDRDPEHRRVFESMDQLSGALKLLAGKAGQNELEEAVPSLGPVLEEYETAAATIAERRPSWMQPRRLAIAAGVLVAIMIPTLYFLGGFGEPPAPELVVYESAVGERKTVELADGSSVTLNAASRISVAFSERERRVSLRHGEIYLDVATEAERPFNVAVGSHSISVIGTAFNVRYRTGPARVTVDEGRVRVAAAEEHEGLPPADALAKPVELGVAQQLFLEPGAVPIELSDEELANRSAWREGWLYFDDQSLKAVVDELSLHVDERIVITSRRAEQLKVGGSFNVDRFDSILNALESLLPVEVTQKDNNVFIAYDEDRG